MENKLGGKLFFSLAPSPMVNVKDILKFRENITFPGTDLKAGVFHCEVILNKSLNFFRLAEYQRAI